MNALPDKLHITPGPGNSFASHDFYADASEQDGSAPYIRADLHEAECDRLRGELAMALDAAEKGEAGRALGTALEEAMKEIEQWKDASCLVAGGDPQAVTPLMCERNVLELQKKANAYASLNAFLVNLVPVDEAITCVNPRQYISAWVHILQSRVEANRSLAKEAQDQLAASRERETRLRAALEAFIASPIVKGSGAHFRDSHEKWGTSNPVELATEALAETGEEQAKPDRITFYELKFYMFSNFSSFAVEYNGRLWPTSEHAYQAHKFIDATAQDLIRKERSAHTAMKLAQSMEHRYRPDWAEVKVPFMLEICRAKLEQHPYIQRKLLETGDRELIESSPIDSFWGWGPNKDGLNHLGKVWMQLREELRAKGERADAPAKRAEGTWRDNWPDEDWTEEHQTELNALNEKAFRNTETPAEQKRRVELQQLRMDQPAGCTKPIQGGMGCGNLPMEAQPADETAGKASSEPQ